MCCVLCQRRLEDKQYANLQIVQYVNDAIYRLPWMKSDLCIVHGWLLPTSRSIVFRNMCCSYIVKIQQMQPEEKPEENLA